MKRVLAKFNWDCGRQGSVNSLFVTTENELAELVGQTIYFGEVLGKHSDISGTLEADDVKVVSEDQEFITKLVEIIGSDTISGHNPLHYREWVNGNLVSRKLQLE
jgi:hypothetical protein